MGTYSIKDLEHLSGIKAHTLRIWEKRYGIINPKRTPTEIRYYNDEDLKLVLNISYLNRNGLKISKIASLSEKEIHKRVMNIAESNPEFPNQIDALILAMVDLNEERFEKIIATNTLQYGFEKTIINIVYPFLERIGIMWQTGSIHPAHEHFISNLIRQKIIVAIDAQMPSYDATTRKFVLFLPEGELHELSLLFSAYILKSRNQRVIYLGQTLPLKDLELIVRKYDPHYLLSVITSVPANEQLPKYENELVRRFPGQRLLLSGFQVLNQREKLSPEILPFESLQKLIEFIEEIDSGGSSSEQKMA